MKTPSTRLLVLGLACLLLVAACGGTSVSTWTIAPLHPTPTPGPQGSGAASAMPSGMHGPSASPGSAPATPAGSAAQSGPPASPAGTGPVSPAAGQTVTLQLTGSLSITDQGGTQVTNLDVHEGETVHFVIDNTAGFSHDFFIGPADALAQNQVGDLPGIPEWNSGVQEFDYTVTADTANLEFACTVPGHYPLMHGTFTLVP
jgi:uncharacterized cupredoxin-like copper-binding protein